MNSLPASLNDNGVSSAGITLTTVKASIPTVNGAPTSKSWTPTKAAVRDVDFIIVGLK
ncbi:hypothetical protein OH492_27630 [Vibrio chagasii]|nr:hypothetical protein [Vibrio chagasii]